MEKYENENKNVENDVREMETSGLIDPSALEMEPENDKEETNKDILLKAVMQELFSTEDISTKTEMNMKQVNVHAQARVFESIYHVGIVGQLADQIEMNMLSHKRASRKEYVKFINNVDLNEEDGLGRFRRSMFGGF